MLAECPEGSGSRDFFDWIKPLSKGCLDEALRASFTIGGYIFYAACESIRRSKTLLLSSMEPELVRDMGVRSFKDMKDLLAEVDFNGKDVYVIPYGGSVLPQTKEAYERICREAEENGGAKYEYSAANCYFICASAVWHQYLCVLQPEKGFRELPFI